MTAAMYQHPGYGQPDYPQQRYPPQQFMPQPGVPLYAQYYAYDPAAFYAFYRDQLRQLVQNSRPVIQQLTQLAIENLGLMGQVVTDSIADYIRNAPVPVKLPAFYLLDSITKNCNPYVSLFAPIVKDLFLQATRTVDPQTRQKLCEMLVTWRNGGPNQTPLFGDKVQVAIEREIWPESDSNRYGRRRHGQSCPTQSQVLTELEVLLALKEKAVQDTPYDGELRGQMDALFQLRNMVQASGVTPNELAEILTSVRSLAKSIGAPAAPPSHVPSAPAVPYGAPQQVPFFQSQPSTTRASVMHSDLSASLASLAKLAAPQPAQSTATTAAAAPSAIPDISSLFKSLVAAGIVPSAGSGAAPAGVTSQGDQKSETSPVTDSELEETLEYERRVLAIDIKLTSADLMKERPEVISLLYDRQTTQCKQCGLRFHDNAKGKKAFQDHLDQHFRQNNRTNQQMGRGYSRSWFIEADDWVHDGLPDTGDRLHEHNVSRSDEVAAKKRKELERSFVVIPPGEDTKPRFCPICKEQLKTEFLEDEEEWVWRNAVEHKSTIYHATCRADALSATLANRLRTETKGSSRAVTPEGRSGTPQLQVGNVKSETNGSTAAAGAKRKAEDDDDAVDVHVKVEEVEPPLKKARPSIN
ncbi:hypothetical protein DACRYDRAFT_92340 [Dacryopinax primogenitus]|uniref:CID domain-containing protein n=1 Tax=Dacryopinax primogenitus (strain DJM 731) TaxID=1858805 RepID=M5GGX9_DACPD|nr:uncharacterized protein DACRYDRAFT_92340 [Dacryopinax primogenitus]EJU06268.1 hypothetical protein DACRYDRAFT_92340 [Dacryopinax primogenitus]